MKVSFLNNTHKCYGDFSPNKNKQGNSKEVLFKSNLIIIQHRFNNHDVSSSSRMNAFYLFIYPNPQAQRPRVPLLSIRQ